MRCLIDRLSTTGRVLMGLGLASLLALTSFSVSDAADPPGTSDNRAALHELISLRTANSQTFERADGTRTLKVFPAPVNFRSPSGAWMKIDNRLLPSGEGLENAANAYRVTVPTDLGKGAVRVDRGGHWLSLTPRGARASRVAVSGASARYDEVWPGVDVTYDALNQGVKETLTLSSPAARSDFEFALASSAGLTARETAGGVQLRRRDGRPVLLLAPPFMRDAAGAESHAVSLELGDDGRTVSLEASRKWLEDPARRYPVEIDPSVFPWGAERNCTLRSGSSANTTYCHEPLKIGRDASSTYRTLLKFDIESESESALPRDAHVLEGIVKLRMLDETNPQNGNVDLHELGRGFTNGATWNRYDGSSTWTTAGGDFATARESRSPLTPASADGWVEFGASRLVEGWMKQEIENRGVLLKAADEGPLNVRRFADTEDLDEWEWPHLQIDYIARVGEQFDLTHAVEQSLGDRHSLAFNPANGNLMLRADDLSIAVTGLDLALSRFHNSRGPGYAASLGTAWNFSVGQEVRLKRKWNTGARVLWGDSGYRARFDLLPDGSFRSPPGLDATLTLDDQTDEATVTFNRSGIRWEFDDSETAVLRKVKDRNGNVIELDYAASRIDMITDTQGRELELNHDPSGDLVTSIEDVAGRNWQYAYDGQDQLISYTDPDGEEWEYDYAGSGKVDEIEDPHGVITRIEYGSNGVEAIKRDWNPVNDTAVATWTVDYDTNDLRCPVNPHTAARDRSTVVTDPRGKDTVYCHDLWQRVTRTIDALGNQRSSSYRASGHVSQQIAPGSAQTDLAYDSLDNLTGIDEPADEQTTLEYNAPGHPFFASKGTSPQGTSRSFAYDTAGNTTSVADGGSPTQVQAALEYNGQAGGACANDPTTKPGTLRCAIDGKGNKTRYGYDDAGNLTSITPELPLGDTTITYDALSRVHTVEDGKGQVRTYSYDPLDRVTQIAYPGGQTVAYDYDANGNRIERIDSVHGTSTWEYDGLNRRIEDTLPSGTTTYAWDPASNLTSLTDPGGAVTYRYDNVNRLADLAELGGSCAAPVSLCTTFGYTNRDQRIRTTYPNGVEETITLDASDKPTRIRAVKGATVLTDFTYVYDQALPGTLKTKLRRSVTDKNGKKTTYGYDFLDRLTSAVERNSANTVIDNRVYTYDLASNRKSQTINGATTSYAYNAANQLCWTYSGFSTAACGAPPGGATTYSYDANGNTTANSAGLDFDNNLRDQTTSFTAPGGTPIAFGYAGAGQAERTSVAGIAQHNTQLGLGREGSAYWTRDEVGLLVSQRAGGQRHYYLSDALGSIVALTDVNGGVAQTYKYDPFGKLLVSTGTVSNPFRFASEYRHAGEIYKIGERYYDPGLGRWTQVDPVDSPEDLRQANPYVYAASDPVNIVDPDGTFAVLAVPLGIGAGELVAAGVGAAAATTVGILLAKEHEKGARPSTKGKHEKGQARQKADQERSQKPKGKRAKKRK